MKKDLILWKENWTMGCNEKQDNKHKTTKMLLGKGASSRDECCASAMDLGQICVKTPALGYNIKDFNN